MNITQIQPWFGRTFEFGLSLEQYPIVCIRLRGTPARLEELLRDVPRDVLTRKQTGKWSAQEHAGHLADLEPLWLARVDDFANRRDALTAADLTNSKTDEADHNSRDVRDIQAAFRSARLRLLDVLGSLPQPAFAHALVHPRLGQPMRLIDHLYFVAEHDDHHLATIAAAIANGASP